MPLSGRCLCGVVRYELDAEVRALVNCHCQFCRRAHGAAFVTTAPVPTRALRFVAGAEHVANYEGRFFCGKCATRLYNRSDAIPDTTALVVTSLDEEPAGAPSAHFNLESKAPWFEIRDDAPRFDAFPPAVATALESV